MSRNNQEISQFADSAQTDERMILAAVHTESAKCSLTLGTRFSITPAMLEAKASLQTVLTKDTTNRDNMIAQALRREGIRSGATSPMVSNGQFIGFLNVGSKDPDSYSEEQRSFLKAIARQIAPFVEGAIWYKTLQHRNGINPFLDRIRGIGNRSMDFFFRELCDTLRDELSFHRVSVALADPYPGNSLIGGRTILKVGQVQLNTRRFEVSIGNNSTPLTPMEFRILHFLMSHKNEVLSIERIVGEGWGYEPSLGSPELVRVHIKNIRGKLGTLSSGADKYIRTIPRWGYTMDLDLNIFGPPYK
jgi:DNA-binding winged helix-turn-helix (wHTH) protein